MNPEIKAKWVAALRSGEYEQGKNCLRDVDNKFCCLGVLTDLYIKEHNEKWVEVPDSTSIAFKANFGMTPKEVREWAQFPEPDPEITIDGNTDNITMWNDMLGANFNQMANAIEEQL